jgi:hypothetical protein
MLAKYFFLNFVNRGCSIEPKVRTNRVLKSLLAAQAQRMSNNNRPVFTDAECLTIYLFYR